jgi:hypothetical protein
VSSGAAALQLALGDRARSMEIEPVGVFSFPASPPAPSSSRLTLSRDIVDRRCVVRRGDLGCFAMWSPCSACSTSPFAPGSSVGSDILGIEGASDVLSGAALLTEEDLRFVRDLVPSVDLSLAGSAGAAMDVSVASSKVS